MTRNGGFVIFSYSKSIDLHTKTEPAFPRFAYSYMEESKAAPDRTLYLYCTAPDHM